MRIVTARQMAAIDRETIDGGVPGIELMERAGREIVRRLLDVFGELAPPARVAVCCGKGNNGGDGLVMARLLHGLGFEVAVLLLDLPEDISPHARENLERLPRAIEQATAPQERWAERWLEICAGAELAVDAVFGTGIRPPVRGAYVNLFRAFQELPCSILSVDIPSGVCGDTGRVDPVAVRADATITVGLPKLGLLLPPGRDHAGELSVVDIGFADEVIARHAPDRHWLPDADYARLLPRRSSDVHKYRCGTMLIVAGSRSFGGAAVLTGLGGLRSGTGLVTVAVPEPLEIPTRCSLPEALVAALPATDAGTFAPLAPDRLAGLLERKHAVACGPGLGADPVTDRWIVDWLRGLELPLVLDADGLSAFGRLSVVPRFAAEQVVLTPHAGELSRLCGLKPAEVEKQRLELTCELAARWGVTLLLKGSPTTIADPGGALVVNAAGNDALAHGGTGDVLTGLIGGLLAQGLPARDAAVLGAFLHGKAGEICSLTGSRRSVLAHEVAGALGEAYADLEDLLGPGRSGERPPA